MAQKLETTCSPKYLNKYLTPFFLKHTNPNFFTTCTNVYVPFIQKYDMQQATTLLQVKRLFATLTVELEATLVK